MTRYVVHIGTHKTASTLIQSFLARNANALLEQGIDFPAILKGKNGPKRHSILADYILGKENDSTRIAKKRLVKGLSTSDTAIVSSEGLCRCYDRLGLKRLSRHFDRSTRFICYLREPVSHAVSFYSQFSRGGGTQTFREFLDRESAKMEKGVGLYSYDAMTWHISKHFPNLVVRPYEKMPADMLIHKFFDYCGIDVDLSGMEPAETGNTALPAETVASIRSLNTAVSNGDIARDDAERASKAFIADPDLCREVVQDNVRYENADLSGFLEVFRKNNPVWSRQLPNHEGDPIAIVPSGVSIPSDELVFGISSK